ncbi:DUF262 domain-containing protein [Enterococcus casseliflavus]|uniref:DUF262 domain-containing protein n=1 Tax=Enterococcus casseliflavus TaxID=37734 RepID=UPI0019150585|nr:DUF262 domain-containing protein [Enterococcus casseliflavus]
MKKNILKSVGGERKGMSSKEVNSLVVPLKTLFSEKFDVDFYQREYVWQRKQLEDLVNDLSNEFLRQWDVKDNIEKVRTYDPYFMGEIVLSSKQDDRNSIIDGQQRITTFTLFLMYLYNNYKYLEQFPESDIKQMIYSDDFGKKRFNLEIDERRLCMLELYEKGIYEVKKNDPISVINIVGRYKDFSDCWNENINESNIIHFIYWIKEKIVFSKVWTNSDEFAYVIFETMNDRGLSLTQVEMLRSYLLAHIDEENRDKYAQKFDRSIAMLKEIKLPSKSKAEFDFFKIYFRGHLAESLSQGNDSQSDFVRIGNEFHRWVRDKSKQLSLISSNDFMKFIDRISYYTCIYNKINQIILDRNTKDFLYVVINADYGFTLQPAALLASIDYQDDDDVVDKKIKIVSKYLTKLLSYRVWNHVQISQSSLESTIYLFCKEIRGKTVTKIEQNINDNSLDIPELVGYPILNQQNGRKIRVLLALITEIVAKNSHESNYILNLQNKNNPIEIEHIWANHFEEHLEEFDSEIDFNQTRNNIGGLLLIPKSFNTSYGDSSYEIKLEQYFSQNILAQTLNKKKYQNSPRFIKFMKESTLEFKPYELFKKESIYERAELYKNILYWNWS